MTNRGKPYKIYAREFKIEVVRLMNKPDKPSSKLAEEIDTLPYKLYQNPLKTSVQ